MSLESTMLFGEGDDYGVWLWESDGFALLEGYLPTVAHLASFESVTLVKILLNPRAKVNIGESNGDMSALMYATYLGHIEVVELLLNAGAKVNQEGSIGNITAL